MATTPPKHRSVRQGRRLSIGPTTARRRPFARRRPGAGFLPAWHPAARVIRRSPVKERFRVYAEDEFFALGEHAFKATRDGSTQAAVVADSPTDMNGWSLGVPDADSVHGARIALGGLLVAGAGALGLVLALNLASATHGRRKAALRVRLNGAPAVATAHVAPVQIARQVRHGRASGRGRQRRAASAGTDARRRQRAPFRRPARASLENTAPSSALVTQGRRVAVAEPVRTAGGVNGGDGRSQATIAAASSDPARAGHGEFGFER